MKFRINVKSLIAGIEPAYVIANTGVIKDNPAQDHIALDATPECLFVIANGGRVSIKNPIPFVVDGACTDYKFEDAGTVTVKCGDLLAVLSSFNEKEVLSVEVGEGGNTELSLRPTSDPEEVQTLPLHSVPIVAIEPPAKVGKQVELARTLFVKCIERIAFAGGNEKERERYLYWVLRTDTGKARFVAGSGMRFAILDIKSETLVSLPKMDMLIPVEATAALLKVFKAANATTIAIRQSVAVEARDHTKNRYSFEAGDLRVVVAGFNPSIKWINEDEVLNRKNNFRAIVAMDDWLMATKGVLATNNNEIKEINKKADKVHITTVTLFCEKKLGQMQSAGTMKSLRKLKLLDSQCSGSESDTSIRFSTVHLEEIAKHHGNSDFIQLERAGKDRPLVLRFYANETITDGPLMIVNPNLVVEEEFTIFIGPMNG